MRLSPRSIFFAIVIFGMPVAVPLGWNAGSSSAPRSPFVIEEAGGAGGIGDAPARTTSPDPTADATRSAPQRLSSDTSVQRRRQTATSSARPSATATSRPEPTATATSAPGTTTPTADSSEPPTDPPVSREPAATPGPLHDRQ